MTFKGNLSSLGLFDVLQNVSHNCLTGTLAVTTKGQVRWLHFQAGKLHLVSLGEKLGLPMTDFLVQRGYVEQKAMDRAGKSRGKSRALLRDVLIKAGATTEEEYQRAYAERIEEFVYEILEVKHADYEFTEGPPPTGKFDLAQKNLNLALEIQPMLVEGARRDDEWTRIRNVVQSGHELFWALGDEPPLEIADDSDLMIVWRALDGQTDVAELENSLPLGRFEIRSAIASLVGLGAARPVTGSELNNLARETLKEGDDGKARVLLERSLELERNNRALRRQLALLIEQSGDRKEAAATWALIGFQAASEGEEAEALEAYQRAASLEPSDVGLRERSFELLERIGDTSEFETATLELCKQLLHLGLNERAMSAITGAMKRPDLADRPELLELLGEIYASMGRPEEGVQRLVEAADKAEKLKDRTRAMAILEAAQRALPDSNEIQGRLSDLRSKKRERARRRRRRFMAIAGGSLGTVLSLFVLYDEISLRLKMDGLVRETPLSLVRDTANDQLARAFALVDAHPLAPSSWTLEKLAGGLIEAEMFRIGLLGEDFDQAIGRTDRLLAVLAGRPRERGVRELRARLLRRRNLRYKLLPWFSHVRPEAGERDASAFRFNEDDVSDVLSLYVELGEEGRHLLRQRLATLRSRKALDLFTRRFLAGHVDEYRIGDFKKSLPELIAQMIRRRDEDDGGRGFLAAYSAVVDAWLAGGERRERAKVLMPLFVQLPETLPGDRAGWMRLIQQE